VEAALRHPDSEVVKEALLASAPRPEGVAVAQRLLSHSLWDVRAAAARVLAMAGRSDSIPDLQAALKREQDAMAREALAEALSALSHR
jgi:HEAT repeat protein